MTDLSPNKTNDNISQDTINMPVENDNLLQGGDESDLPKNKE